MERRAAIALWEAFGALWIVAVGIPLHFLYSATEWDAIAWLAPTNESTWEHFKLAFWPGLAWAGLEWWRLPDQRRSLWTAKLAALIAMPILISVVFYGYTSVLGRNLLVLDIGTFILAVAVGQWIGYRVWAREALWRPAQWLVAILAALFVAFSFRPPDLFLFQEPETDTAPNASSEHELSPNSEFNSR